MKNKDKPFYDQVPPLNPITMLPDDRSMDRHNMMQWYRKHPEFNTSEMCDDEKMMFYLRNKGKRKKRK